MKSLLKDNNRIPANTVCPFRDQCSFAESGSCHHKGVDHPVPFSCGAARAFDLILRNEKVTLRDEEKYRAMIGKRVIKKSKKPFKSTFQINTVKGITENPYCGKIAFTFEEDDSFVNCVLVERWKP